MTAQSP